MKITLQIVFILLAILGISQEEKSAHEVESLQVSSNEVIDRKSFCDSCLSKPGFLHDEKSTKTQGEVQKIVKEYSRGEGPTNLNNGLGYLNSEIHYDKEGREIKKIQFGQHGFMSYETITSYYQGIRSKTVTHITYPTGFWPGTVSLQSLSADHPDRKPDTSFSQNIYKDTLLMRTDHYWNGKFSGWAEYTYNDNGFEIELAGFNGSRAKRGRWVKTTRDKKNRPIKIEELNPDGSFESTETITYDENGLVKIKDYKSRYLTFHVVTKYTYNADGLKTEEIQETFSPEDRKEVRTMLFEYSSKGLLIKEGMLDSLGNADWQKVHEYNASGQKIATKFKEFAYHYKYNKNGDLVSSRFEDSRSVAQSKQCYIYKNGLLQKTENYNREELVNYTRNYYNSSRYLIRQEPMPVEGKEALDWIKYFDYDDKGQLIRMNHKQLGYDNFLIGVTTVINTPQKPQPKPDPYKNYVNQYTYYTYDNQGRQENVYHQGGELTRITQMEEGKYCIVENSHCTNCMPTTTIHMIDRLDTVKIETRGELKIITLQLNYPKSSDHRSFEPEYHYHQNLIREETHNAKGELIGLRETTEDGILLFSSNKTETKSLSTHYVYEQSKSEQFVYERYRFGKLSTTFYNEDGLEYLITNIGDTTEFIYENGQLTRKIRKRGSGYYELSSYTYDKNGLISMERRFKEDGTENFRILYENDGKHIISEQYIYVRPNGETLYVISYDNP